ncbi:SMI1/KNR4 family protein [Longispora albida]|uniref:SMI1/KNR4 family protein n=1 Tax=Longispora albida TaxID=203523 RepID=UPI0003735ACE|nr:SMI1/KNR4 family protein [Longispora albida]
MDLAELASSAWREVAAWLAAYAPETLAGVRPAASEADLAAVEAALGVPLSPDMTALWRATSGLPAPSSLPTPLIPACYHLLSPQEALASWQLGNQLVRSGASRTPRELETAIASQCRLPAGSPGSTWLPAWLPIAEDRSGNGLFLDLRPGPARGCVRRYSVGYWPESSAPAWPGVAVMLTAIAGSLAVPVPAT